MTTGEIEYTPTVIDQLEKTVPGSSTPLVPFEESTYIIYYLFILIMPIALVNLLVSITPCQERIPESGKFLLADTGIGENFACGVRYPGLSNPEYSLRNPESH